jgi:ketosteroid isomerase-like protein
MKSSIMIHLSLAIALLALAQIGCATPQNTNTANTTVATPEPTPDVAAITGEITRIENDWPRIIKERDATAVRRIEADDFVVVYPDGSIGGKEQDAKDIEAGNITYDSWEISDLKVNVIDRDSAVASLRIIVTNGKFKSPDGKSQNISGQYRSVDTFARRNGQWQLVGSATTPIIGAVASASPGASPAASASPATKPSPVPKPSPANKPAPSRRPVPPIPASTP